MAERERNRREMPGLASISDEVRAVFPEARLIHGEEGGREVGKRPTLPPNVAEVDFFKAMQMAAMGQPKGKKR
jgi:hypothetical protein